MLGKKQVAILASFIPSLMAFGGAGLIGVVYLTEWKVIVTKIPFYGGKYKDLKTE